MGGFAGICHNCNQSKRNMRLWRLLIYHTLSNADRSEASPRQIIPANHHNKKDLKVSIFDKLDSLASNSRQFHDSCAQQSSISRLSHLRVVSLMTLLLLPPPPPPHPTPSPIDLIPFKFNSYEFNLIRVSSMQCFSTQFIANAIQFNFNHMGPQDW